MLKLVLFTFAVISTAMAYQNKCPWPSSKYPFDAEKFSGKWYLVSVVLPEDKPLDRCGQMEFKVSVVGNTTRYNYKYKSISEEKGAKEHDIIAQPLSPERPATMLNAVKLPDYNKYIVAKSHVVATDYTSYAILLGCKETYNDKTDMFVSKLFAKVLSREKTIHSGVKKTLYSILSSYNIEESSFKDVDQDNCE